MIDTKQKRSSASRLGTMNVYFPTGGITTKGARVNTAFWYSGYALTIDPFFFWRRDMDGSTVMRGTGASNPFMGGSSRASSNMAGSSGASSRTSPVGLPNTTWVQDSQVYDKN